MGEQSATGGRSLCSDSWSKRLSEVYEVPTVLYDCFGTEANLGHTPSLGGYPAPMERREMCLREVRQST